VEVISSEEQQNESNLIYMKIADYREELMMRVGTETK
jgi:hypothetical protein